MSDTDQKVYEFFKRFNQLNYLQHSILIRPGEDTRDIYYVKSGEVKMYFISPQGESITLSIFGKSTYFPIMLAISNQPNKYYFEALNKLTVHRAPVNQVLEFLRNNPDVLYDLTARFSNAINGLTKRIETLALDNSYEKVLNLLTYFKNKFGTETQLTHDEIASWLGLSRETVSRQIKNIKKTNL